jgi:thioredoxin 1
VTYTAAYASEPPTSAQIDALPGPLLLEFGVDWCPHCQRAQAAIEAALNRHAEIAHLKIEDGPGRRLGRRFLVREWPTLIFLADGQERERLVRPRGAEPITAALERLLATPA